MSRAKRLRLDDGGEVGGIDPRRLFQPAGDMDLRHAARNRPPFVVAAVREGIGDNEIGGFPGPPPPPKPPWGGPEKGAGPPRPPLRQKGGRGERRRGTPPPPA